MKYYILERHNPQLPNPQYRALGKLRAQEARDKENALYGCNIITGYSKAEYAAKCQELNIAQK